MCRHDYDLVGYKYESLWYVTVELRLNCFIIYDITIPYILSLLNGIGMGW